MTWNPDPLVTINGVDYTGKTLFGANVNFGRNNIWDQARASYATIDLINTTNTDFNIQPNKEVLIKVKDSTGTYITLFTGKVTQINNNIQSLGSVSFTVVQTISAIGVFAEMARTIIGDTAWAKEYDDDRMTRIFTDAGVTIDTVDTPGVYEFTSRAADAADAYSLAAEYASKAFGYIYETTDGKVGYANESRRLVDTQANGYMNLPLDYILWRGINSSKTFTDVINDISLIYKNSQVVTSSDAASQATYGLKTAQLTTEIENTSEAQMQADRYIVLRANPRTNINAFSIPVDSDNLTNADRDDLLNVYMGMAIEIDNLPIGIKNTVYKGFVEGWTWSLTQYQAQLTLITTDNTLSLTPTRWQDVSATLIWSALNPTLQWSNYD